MKDKFIGFYDPTKEEIDTAWKDGTFAFDANSLLNLYRYTEDTRNDFINAIKNIKKRLFLPYQSAYEFHNNRLNVIERTKESFNEVLKSFSTHIEKFYSEINSFKIHPSIKIEEIEKINSKFLKELSDVLDKQKGKHPDFNSNDEVLNNLSDIFESYLVGQEFNDEDLKKIYAEGENRYSNKIPPGYQDASNKKNKGDRHVYGDLIIWMELMNFTKSKKRPLVFITDDRKEDWWTIDKGKTIRPREELIKEFFDNTGIRILIYNSDSFLNYAKERGLLPRIKNETIEEIKAIRVDDENKQFIPINELSSQLLVKNSPLDLRTQTFIPAYLEDSLTTMKIIDSLNPSMDLSKVLSLQTMTLKNRPDLFTSNIYNPFDILTSQVNHSEKSKDSISNEEKKILKGASPKKEKK